MIQFSDTFTLLPSQIWVERSSRQRRIIESDDLEQSIKARGQINPIIVEALVNPEPPHQPYKLIAGERRATACTNLKIGIIARSVSALSPLELQLIELEENIKRQDLEWQEIANAVRHIHQLHLGADADWTMAETADSIGLSQGQVSLYIKVGNELAEGGNVRVAEAGTAREAYNIITRRDARQNASALDDLIAPVPAPPARAKTMLELSPDDGSEPRVATDVPAPRAAPLAPEAPLPAGPPPVEDTILSASFLEWAEQYSGDKFNFLHCDFPYGIDFASGPQGRGSETTVYDDSADVYWKLLECLLKHSNKLLSLSSHVVFWYSEKHGPRTREMFSDAGFKVLRYPLIWVKSDNAGVAADSRRTPRHTYETALVAVRGARQLVRVKADAYVAPTDKRLHPSTKPEPMLKHFLEMFVDEYTDALDPTCGSGAAIRACEHFGARRVLGLEIDQQYLGPARAALHTSRLLRNASRI